MTVRRAAILTLGAAALAAAPPVALAATRAKTRTVSVNDNYYGPSKLIVHVGDTVRWRWSQDATDVHDVDLKSAPKGVRKFQPDPLAAGQTFSRRLTRPGTYRIICTFHESEMRMTITVKRRP
ncbi:cupredoxin domain-containing protein [Baekduia soli]|uniref:cupredoxin domain-containing protein n=1 Tax=Baekduia soli TaxID=496014 RepID=UPI00165289E3|nr:cupredoxin domain-containing protein [Baekduia soli]